jgi:DtxR family Mn-dependent transcriptional regulator
MNKQREKDEHLEQLWHMKEQNKDSIEILKSALGNDFDAAIIDELVSEEIVKMEADDKVTLTEKGMVHARQIIRAHRLAERLLYDVLGGDCESGDCESGACEFEHIVTPELVDSICILLGHPRLCPHGMPIPEGQCCRISSRIAQSSIIPLTELEVGQSARIAYINSKCDQQLHKMDNLLIRPGVVVTLHQRYPAYVIECEGSNIAMDEEIISNIRVWQSPEHLQAVSEEVLPHQGRKSNHWSRFRHRRRGVYNP